MMPPVRQLDHGPIAPEFRGAWDAERTRRLRLRILWYCATMIGLATARILFVIGLFLLGGERVVLPIRVAVVLVAIGVAYCLGMAAAYLHASRADLSKRQLLQLIGRVVIAVGVADVLLGSILIDLLAPTGVQHILSGSSAPTELLGSLLVLHGLTALFIPWTPREAIRPLVPLLGLFATLTLLFGDAPFSVRIVLVVMSPLVGLPGVMVCFWRHSRFRTAFHLQMLDESYDTMKRELVDARRIHEALFPPPGAYGATRLSWRYRPVRQIGGDFVFAHHDVETDRFTVLLVDVTGHGIGAALTVNRIHGELQRLYAEDRDLDPGGALTALNRYFTLTLAQHGIFATAIALRADPRGCRLEWASAGHPPAFLLSPSGIEARFDSTTVMLGAMASETFDAEARSVRWEANRRVVAYSDGIIEARSGAGDMLTIDGFAEIIAASAGDQTDDRPARLLRRIRRTGFDVSDDDALIIELGFDPLASGTAPSDPSPRSAVSAPEAG